MDAVVKFYDDVLEGRTAAVSFAFADVRTMFRFVFAMFRSSDVARNPEIMGVPQSQVSLHSSLYQIPVSGIPGGVRPGLQSYLCVFTSCLRQFENSLPSLICGLRFPEYFRPTTGMKLSRSPTILRHSLNRLLPPLLRQISLTQIPQNSLPILFR